MTTALAITCTAIIAFLLGRRYGVAQTLAYVAALFPDNDPKTFIDHQRERAHLQ
jgi:uncharacterized membrane protein YdjX (TVP38/TMEM64 family)